MLAGFLLAHPLGPAEIVRAGPTQDIEQQGLEGFLEQGHATDTHRPDRVAVVSLPKRKELGPLHLRTILLTPVLEGQLHRHLDGTGAITCEKNVLQSTAYSLR